MRSALPGLIVVVLVGVLTSADSRPPTREDSVTMRTKIDQIYANAERSAPSPLRTTITEPEVNAYLAYDAKANLPNGVEQPYVAILGAGRVQGRALVNLDSVKSENCCGMFNPLRLLSGRVPVSTTGILRSSAGSAVYDLESAEVSGVRVPKSLLQQVLSHYSKTPEDPDGLSLDEPFPLPARIQRIEIGTGQAVVVQ
jgi:hypothetical protein